MEANNKPEQAEKPVEAPPKKPSAVRKRAVIKYVLLILLALLIMLPGAAALWVGWQHQQQLIEVGNRLDEITDLKSDITQLGAAQRQLNEQLSSFQQTQREQGDALTKLQNQSPLTTAEIELEWALAEIKYLLNLANQRALLANDTQGAKLALSLADQQIREIGDYRMQPLRELIAEEQLALNAAGE